MSKTTHNTPSPLISKLPRRREFIRQLFLSGIAVQLPFFFSCSGNNEVDNVSRKTEPVRVIQQILFPGAPDSPGIPETGATTYFKRMLQDERIDPEERAYLQDGLQWVNETAQEQMKKDFMQLTFKQQKQLIEKIAAFSWGEAWLSRMLTVIFEALLLDPLYGVNHDESGWKWLKHIPGAPRPDMRNRYPEILSRKAEEIVVSDLSQL